VNPDFVAHIDRSLKTLEEGGERETRVRDRVAKVARMLFKSDQ
jgi:hypothetical protein